MTANGLITVQSPYSASETIDRLESVVKAKGLLVFSRIDHSANATSVGMTLRPTILLMFGHPKGGTPLMQDRQTAGIDLPLKALAWEDEAGRTWLTYNDPASLAARHELSAQGKAAADAIANGMTGIVMATIKAA